MENRFSPAQRRLFTICFLTYAVAYIGRLNLSAVLNSIMRENNLSSAQGGLFQTVFALLYAAGQMVNGAMVDRVSCRRHLFIGMLASGACNLMFGMARSFPVMIGLWMLNGIAQSMLWTPIIKLMTVWFKGKRRSRASFILSMTLILGNLSAWAIAGLMADLFSWRFSFIIPGCLLALFSVIDLKLIRNRPEEGEAEDVPKPDEPEPKGMPLGELFLKTGLIPVLVCCICNGFVRDGIISWAPTILANMSGGQNMNSTAVSLIIPMLNLIGILMAQRVYLLFGSNARFSVMCLMALSGLFSIFLVPASGVLIACAAVLGICCSCTYGINPMLTTFVPMEFDSTHRVGLVAGIVDSFIYLGSSLAGIVVGVISGERGWSTVFVSWCVVAICGSIFAAISLRGRRYII